MWKPTKSLVKAKIFGESLGHLPEKLLGGTEYSLVESNVMQEIWSCGKLYAKGKFNSLTRSINPWVVRLRTADPCRLTRRRRWPAQISIPHRSTLTWKFKSINWKILETHNPKLSHKFTSEHHSRSAAPNLPLLRHPTSCLEPDMTDDGPTTSLLSFTVRPRN